MTREQINTLYLIIGRLESMALALEPNRENFTIWNQLTRHAAAEDIQLWADTLRLIPDLQ